VSNRKIPRRQFLYVGATAAAGAVLAACQPQTVIVEKEKVVTQVVEVEKEVVKEVTVAAPSRYEEAPKLADMVAKEELPPLDSRLPQNPFIVGPGVLVPNQDLPDWKSGEFGGTLRMFFTGTSGGGDYIIALDEPLLSAPGLTHEGIQGNVLESFDVNDDNTAFTFQMRRGLRWSDGEPVTSEDVRFTFEDVMLDEQITPSFPQKYKDGGDPLGEPMQLKILDDYQFSITFNTPYGGFLRGLAIESWTGYTELIKPSHYLKQFHVKYTPLEELAPMIKEGGFAEGEWWNLFNDKDITNWENTDTKAIGIPVLTAWVMDETSTSELLVWNRNPYYFKVDTQGKQLPYIDVVEGHHVQDLETATLKILAGEIDFTRVGNIAQLPLLKENENKGGYKTYLLDKHTDGAPVVLNMTYEDDTWRQVVRDVRLRRALNMGLNREGMIKTVYSGFGELPTSVPTEYNPEQAMQTLDEIGLDQKDADGWRLGPDGEVFEILIETIGVWEADMIPVTQLVTQDWQALGIKTNFKQVDPTLWGERRAANQLQASVLWGAHDKGWQMGFGVDHQAPLWQVWMNTDGEEGEEPPDWVQWLFALNVEKTQQIPGSSRWKEIEEEMLQIEYDNILQMVIAEKVKYPVIANAGIRNVQQSGYGIGANFAVEQFYYEQ
jgi:peptide/nickel transport system substrate-binding protein